MESFLLNRYRSKCNPVIFKVRFRQGVRMRFKKIENKFIENLDQVRFGSKDFCKSFNENFFLFEKFLAKVMFEKIKDRPKIDDKVRNYEEVMERVKAEKKFRKVLSELEDELKGVRERVEKIELRKKEELDAEEKQKKKQKSLEVMQEKAKIRLEKRKNQLSFIQQTPRPIRPRNMKLEESFKSQDSISQTQKNNRELSMLSEKIKSNTKNDLLAHTKHYTQLLAEAKKIRSAKRFEFIKLNQKSPTNQIKKLTQEEIQQKFNRKKIMMNKRKEYSSIVKELYSPKFRSNPVKSEKEPEKNTSENEKKVIILTNTKKINKRKFKSLTPEPVAQDINKEKVKRNYLTELKELREKQCKSSEFLEYINIDDIQGDRYNVIKKLKEFDRILVNEEKKIKFTDKRNLEGVQIQVKASELLIHTVKAKLKLLCLN